MSDKLKVGVYLLNNYSESLQAIYEHCGFKEDWCVFPIDNLTGYYWYMHNDLLHFNEEPVNITQDDIYDVDFSDYFDYSTVILNHSQYPKGIYRGKELSLIVTDSMTDGNKFFTIVDNSKEIKYE